MPPGENMSNVTNATLSKNKIKQTPIHLT